MHPSGVPHSEKINNEQPNEGVCRVDKFEVIKYTIGDNEEFLAICIRECDSWAQTINGVSSIYHDIFRKKDEGWTEDFDALLNEGSKILYCIEGTPLEDQIFTEFDEFMAMNIEENFESNSDKEEIPFEKITFDTDYKIKKSLDEPPTDLELKPLLDHLEYAFLEEPSFFIVIISSQLTEQNKNKPVFVLKKHKQAFAWKTTDLPGVCPSFSKHKIQLLDDKKPIVQKQRRFKPNIQEVVKKEIVKLLDTEIIYPIADSPWVSPIHRVPKKGGITVVTNEKNELVPTRTVKGWRVCIDYRKLNEATAKDHVPLPFMDQMLKRLTGNKYLCILDGFLDIFKYQSILHIKKKQRSHALSEHTLIGECLLIYVMLPLLSKDAY
ncbi:hypothetical protein Tco_1417832 [Tanacetum coccineum]